MAGNASDIGENLFLGLTFSLFGTDKARGVGLKTNRSFKASCLSLMPGSVE